MNTLREAAQEYLAMRRNLGFKLRDAGVYLLEFVSYMEIQHAPYITCELALAWAQQPSGVLPSCWANRLGVVRAFARHRGTVDPRTEIPPPGLLPHRPQRAQPYLYSTAEIVKLLDAARRMPDPEGLRRWTYYCFFGLLSVTGLRFCEACALQIKDVDLKSGMLMVRNSKFGKSRLLPLHRSTCRVLRQYLEKRELHWTGRPVSNYLFVGVSGQQLYGTEVRQTFYRLSREIGLRNKAKNQGPRLHDFRHRFAMNALLRWYRSGDDPERRLPVLSAYLGHVHYSNTYWYLSNCPELMRAAMQRLERRWENQP